MVGEMEEQIQPDWEMVEAEPRPPTPPTPSLPFSPADIHMGIKQLEVQEDEEEEGPPPGWNIIPQLQSNAENENMDDDDDDDDDDEGPPPGWDFTPKSEQPVRLENKDIEEERQPPGWHFVSLPESEIGNDHQDIEEEGPPPGWPSMPPTQQSTMIEKEEFEVGSELGSHIVPSPQIRIRSELEAVKDKEIGIQHEKSSIDLLQPVLEYMQDLKGAQPGLNSMTLPQPRVTSPMVPPSSLQLSDADIKSEQEVADEEAPPPGWHSVEPNKTNSEHQDITEEVSCGWMSPEKRKTELQKEKIIEVGAEEEGPPPGWNSIEKNKIDSEHQDVREGASRGCTSENTKTELEKQDIFEGEDEEGPPPGWHFIEKNKINSEHQDIKDGASRALMSPAKLKTELEKEDIVDEGPPPGWNLIPPPQSKSGSENHAIKSEGSPHGLGPSLPKLDGIKQDIGEDRPQIMSNSVCQQPKMGHSQQEVKEERSQPGSNFMPPPSPQQRPPMPTTTPMSSASRRPTQSGSHLDMGQLVCGSCRRLLSYARGAKYVKCSCCQTVNLVLEAHQVGQVKCGGCEVLLMYQFGANAVQCASCRHVTEIVVQNRRPPLSVLQARGRRHGISNR